MAATWIPLSGDTYPVRGALKEIGARWDAANRRWLVLDRDYDVAMYLIGGGSFRAYLRGIARIPRYPRPEAEAPQSPRYVCDECGAELVRPFCPSCRDEMFIREIA